MKKYIVCKKIEKNSYHPSGSGDESLITLFLFFTDGVSLDYFQKWLDNINEDETGTNTCILKKVNNLVEVSLDSNIWGVENPIFLTQENFSKAIDQWEKLYDERWDEIIITQDDSGVHLVGKNRE